MSDDSRPASPSSSSPGASPAKYPASGNGDGPRTPPRVLATDLDGTLIPLEGDEQNCRDLQTLTSRLRQEQVRLVFVTGRHLEIVLTAAASHRLPTPDWIICDVGSTIYQGSPEEWQPLNSYRNHLQELCASLPMSHLRSRVPDFAGMTLQEEEKQGEFKLSFYAEPDRLQEVEHRLHEWLRVQVAPYSLISSIDPFTGAGLIDILPRSVSKAYAVEWWRRHSGFEQEDLVFAGDSGNDWAALVAGYRTIVVANAGRELAERVQQEHRRRAWSDRLFIAHQTATSGVLAGCQWFGLLSDEPTSEPG